MSQLDDFLRSPDGMYIWRGSEDISAMCSIFNLNITLFSLDHKNDIIMKNLFTPLIHQDMLNKWNDCNPTHVLLCFKSDHFTLILHKDSNLPKTIEERITPNSKQDVLLSQTIPNTHNHIINQTICEDTQDKAKDTSSWFFPGNNIEIPKGTLTSEDSNNEHEEELPPKDNNEWTKVTRKEKKRSKCDRKLRIPKKLRRHSVQYKWDKEQKLIEFDTNNSEK